jgi:hypothetical protein
VCIRFCTKLKKVRAEPYGMVKSAFQREALSHEKVIDWFHCYEGGCTSTESDKHSGYPSSGGNDEVISTVHDLVIARQLIGVTRWCTAL